MNQELLEKVLSCSRLPSLPEVALRVIDLTARRDVPLREIAETIEADQGLATKILKTVNSPFYGLTKPCSTIHQAQLMLGLNGIKTLALGFSLVSSLNREVAEGFDYVDYWRRAIYTAVASRSVALLLRACPPEEAFLGGLLQDIGMIAMHQALGAEYIQILRDCGDQHHDLGGAERRSFELHHAEIGAMLAERWRLPDSLIVPIRFHEKPTAAPADHQAAARCVGLGNLAAAALTQRDPGPWVTRFRDRAHEWFAIAPEKADELLGTIKDGGAELASLLRVKTGPEPDVADILSRANDRLVEIAMDADRHSAQASQRNDELQRALQSDPLTGVASKRRFVSELADSFSRSNAEGAPVSLALIDPDDLRRVNNDYGWDAGDALLKRLAERLQDHFRPYRGLVGRWGGEEFGVLLTRLDRPSAARLLQAFCDALAENPIDLSDQGVPPGVVAVTVSAGLATYDSSTIDLFTKVEHLLNAADQGLHAAKRAGGNGVRIFTPRHSAAA